MMASLPYTTYWSTLLKINFFPFCLQAFPTKLKYMCICLSEVIFMEGFMRKIYNFINGLEILHLIGKQMIKPCILEPPKIT